MATLLAAPAAFQGEHFLQARAGQGSHVKKAASPSQAAVMGSPSLIFCGYLPDASSFSAF